MCERAKDSFLLPSSTCTTISSTSALPQVHDVLPSPSQRLVFTPVPDKPPVKFFSVTPEIDSVNVLYPSSVYSAMGLSPPAPINSFMGSDWPSTSAVLCQASQDSFMGSGLPSVSVFPGKKVFESFVAPRPLLSIGFGLRPTLHHSVILQIDGLLHACFRLRLERDVCVLPNDIPFCHVSGPGLSPASTFCGLYWPAPPLLTAVLRAVKLERGYGVFVGSVSSEAWRLIDSLSAQTSRTQCHINFSFVGADSSPWCAKFCSFTYQGKIKRRKPDTAFAITPILSAHVPLVVSILPFCPARVSAMHHIPVAHHDTAKRCAPLPCAIGIPLPQQSTVWNVHAMQLLAPLFPHHDVASLFTQVIQPTGARLGFAGDNSKRVIHANATMDPVLLAQIRERFTTEVSKGRMMGPFSRCPFPNEWNMNQARSTPLDTRKKDKYDPLSDRFRVVSNFSAGRNASINNLIYSPKLLSAHLHSSQLRDILFSLGPNARFSAIDQQDAFRADHIHLDDAHLYCYQLAEEWFIDLRDPFGNIKSEYAYAIIVAVLKWAFECNEKVVTGDSKILGYVDNWFLLSRSSCTSHDVRWSHLKSIFNHLGAPMHEEQCSLQGVVNALGWDWDLKNNLIRCPKDKYDNCLMLTTEWSRRASINDMFSFNEIESIAGLFQWISTACTAIIPAVASLQAFKHAMKLSGMQRRCLDGRCSAAVISLAVFFLSWNRACPIFAGFSPSAHWEVLVRVDASTDFGTGGFCFPSRDCMIHQWSADERACALAHSTAPLRESTTYFELQGIFLLLKFFAPNLRGKRVQVECDNEAAVRDLVSCFSGKPVCMDVIARIRDLCASFSITIRVEHILAPFNCIADYLSHDLFSQASTACTLELGNELHEPHRL